MDLSLLSDAIIVEVLNQIPIEPQKSSMRSFLQNLLERLPQEMWSFVKERDGAARFAKELPKAFPPETVFELREGKSPNMAAWEMVGRYYMIQARYHEALLIFFHYMAICLMVRYLGNPEATKVSHWFGCMNVTKV